MRNNSFIIGFFDAIVMILFFIPVMIRKIKRSKIESPVKEILIVELWGIGDVVMMSGILKPLRQHFPEAKISLLSKSFGKELLERNNVIDEFFEFNFPWTRFERKYCVWNWDWRGMLSIIQRLRAKKYDIVLDARGDIRNNILSYYIQSKRNIGYDLTGGDVLLTDVLSGEENLHRVIAWQKILNYLKVASSNSGPFLVVTDEERKRARGMLERKGILPNEKIIGIHPGAGVPVRQWSLEKFSELAKRIQQEYQQQVVVFLDPEGYGDDIPVLVGKGVKIQVSLSELIPTLSNLEMLICNDSGVMHIATAVGIPVVAIFGPGNIDMIGPFGEGHKLVMKEEVACRPCYDNCGFEKPFCIEDIKVEDVLTLVKDQIGRNV